MKWRKPASWLLFACIFAINPNLACSDASDPEFSYGESDMQRAILGTWNGTAVIGGLEYALLLVLEQAPSDVAPQKLLDSGSRLQCGTRSFVRPASACASVSRMPLLGMLTSDAEGLSGPVQGALIAYYTLDAGAQLELELDTGIRLEASAAGGEIQNGHIRNPEMVGSFSLVRP